MARATFKVMEAAGGRLQRYAPALSRHTAGRALLYGVTLSRLSRVPAEQAQGDMARRSWPPATRSGRSWRS
jgi:hypothetical protein